MTSRRRECRSSLQTEWMGRTVSMPIATKPIEKKKAFSAEPLGKEPSKEKVRLAEETTGRD